MPVSNKMVHQGDPKKELADKVGTLDGCDVYHNQVLVAVYKRPDKLQLAGGKSLYLPDQTRKEDEYQGIVGLVLKCGPMAFVGEFADQSVSPGDWIAFRTSDAWSLEVNGVLCRMLHDVDVKLRVPSPDYVY